MASSGEYGTVTPNGEILVHQDSSLTFVADPAWGYEVDKWTMEGQPLAYGVSSVSFDGFANPMDLDVSFKPTFQTADLIPLICEVGGMTSGIVARPGEAVYVNVGALNVGTLAAGASQARVYWSTDSEISADDLPLWTPSFPELQPGNGSGRAMRVKIPSNATSGATYYMGVVVDYANQVPEGNWEYNNTSLVIPVTITNPESLKLESPKGGDVWLVGETYTVEWVSPANVGDTVIFCMYHQSDRDHYFCSVSEPNDGEFVWNISGNTRIDPYRMGIYGSNGPFYVMDEDFYLIDKNAGLSVQYVPSQGDPVTIMNGDATPNAVKGTDFGAIEETSAIPSHKFQVVNTNPFPVKVHDSTVPHGFYFPSKWSNYTLLTGESKPFYVEMDTSFARPGLRSGSLVIDTDQGPYIFALEGEIIPAFTVSRPNGGEIWRSGSTEEITWWTLPDAGDDVTIKHRTSRQLLHDRRGAEYRFLCVGNSLYDHGERFQNLRPIDIKPAILRLQFR